MTFSRLFVGLGGLLVLALFAALVVPPFIDWTNYRAEFERELSRILGQDVRVNGSADARLLPFPSVTFNDVEVGGTGDEAMMRIARFSMDVELAPFLSGETRIIDMHIDEPEVRMQLGPDGALDWAERRDGGIGGGTVVIENLSVSNGTLIIDDVQNGRTHRAENIEASISAQSLIGPWRVEGTGSVDGQSGAFFITTGAQTDEGGLRVRTRLMPDAYPVSIELEGTAAIEAMKPSYNGTFAIQVLSIDGQVPEAPDRVALRGTGRFDASNERLRIDEYQLEVGARDDPYIVTGEATIATGEEPEFLVIAEGQQIDVDRLGAGRAGGESEAEPDAARAVSAAARIATLRGILEQIPIPDLPGHISLSLPAVIAGETTLRQVHIDARPSGDAWQVDRFAAALPGRTQIEATGLLGLGRSFGFSGNLVVASNQPSGFAAWLTEEVHPAIRGLDAAGVEADVALSERLQRFENLELVVGDATLTGRFERVVDERPALALDIAGDMIDLEAVNALVGLFTGGDGAGRLAGHDIAARLTADRFFADAVEMAGVETAFTLRNGLLALERLRIADVAGLRIGGQGTFSDALTDPQGTAEFRLRTDDPSRLFALLETRLGDRPDIRHLRANASLFDDTAFDVSMRFGSARETSDAGQTSGYDLDVSGTSGGTEIALSVWSDAALAEGFKAPLSLTLEAENQRADSLLAQIGLPVLPFDIGRPLRVAAHLDGEAGDDARFDVVFANDDDRLQATGQGSFGAGRMRAGSFDLSLSTGDIDSYLLLFATGLPASNFGLPASLSAKVSVDEEQWLADDIEGRLGDNGFAGALTVGRETTPAVEGRIAFDTLDLGWLAEAVYGQPFGGTDGWEWSESRFSPYAAAPFEAAIEVEAARFYLGFAEAAERLQASIGYGEGRLQIDDVQADWLGGRLEGNLALANADGTGTVQLQMQMREVYLARALAGAGREGMASGLVDLLLTLEGSGRNPAALARSMTGSGAATLLDLRIEDLNSGAMDAMLRDADAEGFVIAEPTVREAAIRALPNGIFAVDHVNAPFTIAGGVLRASNIVAANPDAEARGSVQFRLGDGVADASFDLAFEAGDEALPGASPTIGLHFSGPLNELDRRVDATEMANFLSLRAYERERRRVERVQAAVLEKQRLRREAAHLREAIRDRQERREADEAAEAERRARDARRIEEERIRLESEAMEAEVETPVLQDETSPEPETELPATVPSFDFDALPGVQDFNQDLPR